MSIYSGFEETTDSNIVSLENLDFLSDKYLLRAPKKGKLLKGPNWTAYNRENLGTIPRKTEKVLIEDKTLKTKLGFTTQEERFTVKSHSVKNMFPGPGTYNKVKDKLNLTSSSMSSRGYGNGFASQSERFDDPKFYYDKFYPGPGQYNIQSKVSLKNEIDHNIMYKSLYDKTNVKSLKMKQERPGPGFYNPILLTTTEIKGTLSSFKSNASRFIRDTNSAYPGPGKYFREKNKLEAIPKSPKDDIKSKTLSYFFRKPSPKKEDPLLRYVAPIKETSVHKKQLSHADEVYLKERNIQSSDKYSTQSTFYKTNNAFNTINKFENVKINGLTKKDLMTMINNKHRAKSITQRLSRSEKRNQSAHPNLSLKKSDMYPKLDYLGHKYPERHREVQSKIAKKPLFELSPPRWTEKQAVKIPGPAYYNPSSSPKKTDFFNDNIHRWI
jgi:hypothetical protein